jgi:alpha-glucosidase
MINFIENNKQITVLFKGEKVLEHSLKKPVFYLGYGMESIESYRGNFKIEDYIEQRIGLADFTRKGNTIRFTHHEVFLEVAFAQVEGRLEMRFTSSQGYNRFWMRVFALKEEHVYGCGEQASYFNLRGRNFPLWTSEPGVGRDPNSLTTFYANLHDRAGGDYYNTYYPEPTFVSTRKYWLHADTYAYAEFNFKHQDFHELFFWEVPNSLVIAFENSYLNILSDLTSFTGHPPMLPDFLLDGMILGVQGGMRQVLDYLELTQNAGVRVSGLWCQDWAGYKYTSFGKRLFWNWVQNKDHYPNLQENIEKLQKENVQFLGYICPFLLEGQSLYKEAKNQGFLALNKDQDTYLVDFGEFDCGIVDLTNPKAFDWYKGIIKSNLIDLGMKGWMADFGEYLPVDCHLHNQKDAKLMHNEWPVLWAKCNYEAVKESGKLGQVFYFMRAGAHGSQKYATSLWAGDQSVNWELHDGIASVIPSALSVGMIGNPYTHSDIGGYTSLHGNIRTKELFERWLEMNVFTAYMRTHEGNRPDENFQFYQDADTLKLMARMTQVRAMMKDYIAFLFQEAHAFGYPVQRPLFLHYEEDQVAYDLQYQYLFGSDVLVCPVIEANQTKKEVYLPEDTWVHLWTGQEFSQAGYVHVDSPIGYPPVFYKKNSSYHPIFSAITEQYRLVKEHD